MAADTHMEIVGSTDSVSSSNHQTKEPSYDKATGEVIGYSPVTTVEDLKIIMEKARKAQIGWVKTSVSERAALVKKLSRQITLKALFWRLKLFRMRRYLNCSRPPWLRATMPGMRKNF